MEIKNQDKKEVIKNFVYFLENNSLRSKENKMELCYLFSQYCMNDLAIPDDDEIILDFVKTKNDLYGSNFLGLISINKKYLGSNLHVVLDTIAHELRHQYQMHNINHSKKINVHNEVKFPVNNFDTETYRIFYDEEGLFFNVYYTSEMEHDARTYASQILDKFLNDIKLQNSAFATAWANTMLIKNDEYKKFESQKYNNHLQKLNITKNRIQNYAKHYTKCLLAYSLNSNVVMPDNLIENYLKYIKKLSGSYGKAYDILLNYYCNDEICQQIIDNSIKLKDISTLIFLMNHENTNLSEKNIIKCLAFITDKKPLSYEQLKEEYLYEYDDLDIKKILYDYNNELEKYLKKQENTQKNANFDEKTR